MDLRTVSHYRDVGRDMTLFFWPYMDSMHTDWRFQPLQSLQQRKHASSEIANPSQIYFSSASNREIVEYQQNAGNVHFFQADFFDKNWARGDVPKQFDLVYDYTVSSLFAFDSTTKNTMSYK